MATTGPIEGIGFGSTKNIGFPIEASVETGLSLSLSSPDQPAFRHEEGGSQEPDSLHITALPQQSISDALAVLDLALGNESSAHTAESTQNRHNKQLSQEEVKALARKFEEALNSTEVRFKVDIQKDDNNQLKFQVVDKKTGRVLRQYPPDEILAITEQVKNIKGVFLTHTA